MPTGQVITFYSYKGGTGRSMILANVAWLLASGGKRVIAIDWDLEAPGLHNYFRPFLADRELTSSEGIIDFVIDFAIEAASDGNRDDMDPNWYLPHANLIRYAIPLDWDFEAGSLDFIPAGRQGASYATRVNSFNWKAFYEKFGGGSFLSAARELLIAEYDYVLIDSRTGVSDTAGICTIQFPDMLVVCFTLNNQGIDGAAAVADSIVAARHQQIQIVPVPMRVELNEKKKLDARRRYAVRKFDKFLTHLQENDRRRYWSDLEVLYVPYYAYEEVLATFGDMPGEGHSLLASVLRITHHLTEGKIARFDLISEEQRQKVLAEYEGGEPGPFYEAPLPASYVPREQEHRHVLDRLLGRDTSGEKASTIALVGAAGFGKTTMAQAICRDPRVRSAFPDGILWVTLGQHPAQSELLAKILDLVFQLTGTRPAIASVEAGASELARHLGDRQILLVVDDVWQGEDLLPFLRGGTRTVRLITTRGRHLLPQDARVVRVDALVPGEAATLLGWNLPTEVVIHERVALESLARRLGGWPLLIVLVNSLISEFTHLGLPARQALNDVGRQLDRDGIFVFDSWDEARRPSLRSAIKLSLERLHLDERARYRELAVFPEDVDVPLDVVARFWNETGGLEAFKASSLCVRLDRLSLLWLDLNRRTLRLHDVMRAYLLEEVGEEIAKMHTSLLKACVPPSGQWWDLPRDDGYMWQCLTLHLRAAGDQVALRATLADYRWIIAKLEIAGINALIRDYWTLPSQDPIRIVGAALKLSSHIVTHMPDQLAPQLIGRLILSRIPAVHELLAQAAGAQETAWFRPLLPGLEAPGGPLVQTLSAHSDEVTSVAPLPDGRAITASRDHTLKLWEIDSGTCLLTLEGHSDEVTSVAALQNGRVISASRDHTLKLWELDTGVCIRTLEGHSDEVTSVAVLPDGRVISASRDRTLKAWEVDSGACIRTFEGHSAKVTAVATLPDGRVISASRDHTLRLWDTISGDCVVTLRGHSDEVDAIAVLPDGRVISGSRDRTLKLWDTQLGRCILTLEGHTGAVGGVAAVLHDKVISASRDRTLKLWEVESGRCILTLEGHSDAVDAVASLPGGRVISASRDCTLKLWEMESRDTLQTVERHSDEVCAVAAFSDTRIISASSDRTLKIWDLRSGQCLLTFVGHSGAVCAVAILPGGRIISGSEDCTLKLWDTNSGQCIRTLLGHTDGVKAVTALSDGRVISASRDRTLKLWDTNSGQLLYTLEGHTDEINGVAVLPDGGVVSSSRDSSLKLWDVNSGLCIRTLISGSLAVCSVVVLSSKWAIAVSEVGKLNLWNLATGSLIRSIEGHSRGITAVTTAGPQVAVTASEDHTLVLWDIATGQALARLYHDSVFRTVSMHGAKNIIAGDSLGRLHAFELHL